MYIAHVIPLKKGIPFDTVTYYWAEELSPGTMVKITINARLLLGLVVKSESALEARSSIKSAPFTLKKIASVLGATTATKALMQAILKTHQQTLAPLGAICAAVVAPVVGELKFEFAEEVERRARANRMKFSIVIESAQKRFEQYNTLVRGAFAKGNSICFVAPTIHDANILHAFLAKGMPQKVTLLHNALPVTVQKERIENAWTSTSARAFVVTVPYVSTLPPLSAIVIEKESSDFYKTNDRFHIDTRLFIRAFAETVGTQCVYADTLPRFETLATLDTKTLLQIGGKHPFTIIAPDESKKEQLFPKSVEEKLAQLINERKRVWILAHRKGLAPLSRCKDCGAIVTCPDCGMPLVLKQKKDAQGSHRESVYVCNRCGFIQSAATPCRTCKSWNIFPLRIGSDAIVEYMARNYFEAAEIMTHDRLLKRVAQEKKQQQAAKNKKIQEKNPERAEVYIGTEAMLPYLETIDLALIPFFDRLYATPSYETTEHILRSLFEADEHADEVVVITKQKKNDLLDALKQGGLRSFITNELTLRKDVGFPPYGTLFRLTVSGRAALWPAASDEAQSILTQSELCATALPLIQSLRSGMQLEKSWIIQTNDEWLSEKGETFLQALETAQLSFVLERNPHYFV